MRLLSIKQASERSGIPYPHMVVIMKMPEPPFRVLKLGERTFKVADVDLDKWLSEGSNDSGGRVNGVQAFTIASAAKPETRKMGIVLPTGVYDELKSIAFELGVSKSAVIRNALSDYFASLKQDSIAEKKQ